MKTSSPTRFFLGTACVALGTFTLNAADALPPAAGHWVGSVKMQERDVPLALDLAQSPQGAWIGTIGAPGSTMADVPLENLKVTGKEVHFDVRLQYAAGF